MGKPATLYFKHYKKVCLDRIPSLLDDGRKAADINISFQIEEVVDAMQGAQLHYPLLSTTEHRLRPTQRVLAISWTEHRSQFGKTFCSKRS